MAVRGEEVAVSIDAHVREAIERMVGEIRSSIEDVREAVDSQLKAALQSVQADVNALTFLPHLQKTIGELEESTAATLPPPAAAPAAGGGDTQRLKRAVQGVEKGKSQVDVLNALLEQCLDFGSRAALLILRGETFSGWKGVGFSAHGGNDEMVKRFNAAPGLIPELDTVLREERVVTWDGANLSTRFGVSASSRAILVPMVIKDKVAAAVYVDATDEDSSKLDPASVELLVFATGLLIDTLSVRKKIPSPSLTGDDASASAGSAPAPAPAARPAAPAPAAPPPPPAPAPRPTPPPLIPDLPAANETMAMTAAQMREMVQAARPSFNVPSADDFSSPTPAPARPSPAPAPEPASRPSTAPGLGGAGEERPSTQYIPPAGIRGGAGAAPKVDSGRKNKDLYERLKEDIDRSRQMYDERIGEDVRKTSNYFYDELVRILADGDAGALGL
jgi:hypothetical protein